MITCSPYRRHPVLAPSTNAGLPAGDMTIADRLAAARRDPRAVAGLVRARWVAARYGADLGFARALGTDGFGEFYLVLTATQLLALLGGLGLPGASTRFVSEYLAASRRDMMTQFLR